MTPAEWNRVKELFQTALDLDPSQRVAFLAENCYDDQIRTEVERLLRNYQEAASFFNDPALNPLWEDRTTEGSSDSRAASTLFTTPLETEVEDPMTGRRLGDYRVVRRIGQGGMAAVFLATRADDEYQKQVAIKLVHQGLDSRELLSRFRKERQTLADLDHPNIVKLLDGGSTQEGAPFLVMDYVEGTPIDEFCDHHKLCVGDRLRLFSKVCEALQYAHRKSIVHRDLKPSNILVTDGGTPKVLDFGIAKVLRSTSAQTLTLTQTRTRCMTPAYASPEQMCGKPITTATDIYSLGVVLYELLSGHRPYRLKENTPVEIERAICEQEPEPPSTAVCRVESDITSSGVRVVKTPELVSETREGAPEKLRRHLRGDLDNIVLKALQKEPKRRYASVGEFSEDIARHLQHLPVKARRPTVIYRASKFMRRHKTQVQALFALLVVVAAAVSWTFNSFGIRDRFLRGTTSTRIQSLAVLPLANLSGDPAQEYFSDGITDALITDLAQIRAIKVISRTSSMQYKQTKKSLPKIARELDVDGIVEGTVQRKGDRVRITAQLIHAPTDRHMWAETYERDAGEVMRLEDQVALAIAHEVSAQLTLTEERRLTNKGVTNARAYDSYLHGRYLWNERNEETIRDAIGYFEQAVREEPDFALAYSGLSECYSVGWGAMQDLSLAEEYARKAVALQPDLVEGHTSLGLVDARLYKFADAEKELRQALKLDPNYMLAHHYYAGYLVEFGRSADALAENDRARQLDPFSFPVNFMRGVILGGLRQFDRAVEQFEHTAAIKPQSPTPHGELARLYWIEQRVSDALAEERKVATLSHSPEMLRDQEEVAATYAKLGPRAAQFKAAHLKQNGYKSNYYALDVAIQYGGLKDNKETLGWLNKSFLDKDGNLPLLIKTAPEFDFVRSDPQFQDLVQRIGLPK